MIWPGLSCSLTVGAFFLDLAGGFSPRKARGLNEFPHRSLSSAQGFFSFWTSSQCFSPDSFCLSCIPLDFQSTGRSCFLCPRVFLPEISSYLFFLCWCFGCRAFPTLSLARFPFLVTLSRRKTLPYTPLFSFGTFSLEVIPFLLRCFSCL